MQNMRSSGSLFDAWTRLHGFAWRWIGSLVGVPNPIGLDMRQIRPKPAERSSVRIAEVIMAPLLLLAQAVVVMLFVALAGMAMALRSIVMVCRRLLRPVLYAAAVAGLLMIGAAVGYIARAYQTFGAPLARQADADDPGPPPPQTQIPQPLSQGGPSPAFGPAQPRPQPDPFGLKRNP